MFSLPDYRSSLDVYDTTLPTNSLLAKSIQILTVASRFLTARPAPDTYLSNMRVRPAGSVCVSEADKSSCSLSHVGCYCAHSHQAATSFAETHGNRGERLRCALLCSYCWSVYRL